MDKGHIWKLSWSEFYPWVTPGVLSTLERMLNLKTWKHVSYLSWMLGLYVDYYTMLGLLKVNTGHISCSWGVVVLVKWSHKPGRLNGAGYRRHICKWILFCFFNFTLKRNLAIFSQEVVITTETAVGIYGFFQQIFSGCLLCVRQCSRI